MAPPPTARKMSISSDTDSDDSMDDAPDNVGQGSRSNPPVSSSPPPLPPVPRWSRTLRVLVDESLTGDRMKMSPDVLEEILNLAGSSALPSPLVFEIVSTRNRVKVFGSVREFTAAESDTVLVGDELARSLISAGVEGIMDDDTPTATVKLTALPKCDYLKLAPLEETYLKIPDIRASLEAHLRKNYATISEGETLTVIHRPANSSTPQKNHFLITEVRPSRACTCIDVDINLDIVPLDSGLAERAVRLKHSGPTATLDGDAILVQLTKRPDGKLALERTGNVAAEHSVHYKMRLIEDARNLKVSVEPESGDADLFVSTSGEIASLRDHRFMDVSTGTSKLHFEVDDDLSETPFIFFTVRGFAPVTSFTFRVEASSDKPPAILEAGPVIIPTTPESPPPDSKQCDNCFIYIPMRTFTMHQAFCFRNNAVCQQCRDTGRPFIFKKDEIANHWHCTECWKVGSITEKDKHLQLLHTPIPCDCGVELPAESLAAHRRTTCPDRLIICRFCRLHVRAGPPSKSSKDLLLGGNLSEHESECGGRTIQCAKCHQNVQLKDVKLHAQVHDLQRKNQPRPAICANSQCSNMAPEDRFSNVLRLCRACFSPFWSARHDPQNQKLATKLMGAYHAQFTIGCERSFCKNMYCATSENKELLSAPMDANDSAIRSLALLKLSAIFKTKSPEYHLCVSDPGIVARRTQANTLVGLGYHVSWCIKALMECKDDAGKAVDWLMASAPRLDEMR
ncbi:hypothetical protein HDU67_004257 [Dinochytrium kinnereticum]|nr:hypothetical protein HDU67_004257 [Dinochytrium kinnereticum]